MIYSVQEKCHLFAALGKGFVRVLTAHTKSALAIPNLLLCGPIVSTKHVHHPMQLIKVNKSHINGYSTDKLRTIKLYLHERMGDFSLWPNQRMLDDSSVMSLNVSNGMELNEKAELIDL